MVSEQQFYIAPDGWTEQAPNPFTADGRYGKGWSTFRVRDEADDRGWNGAGADGMYCYVVGKRSHNLAISLADYVRYEAQYGRKPIVSLPPDFEPDAFLRQALDTTPTGPVIRADDPPVMVHTTTAERWQNIRACGELRSMASLLRSGYPIVNIGGLAFNEPDDYAEHIILGRTDVCYPEFVVLSHQLGRILTDVDHPYIPGTRIYLDAHRIIRDGIAVRDGRHNLKVKDRLPLDPYMLAAVDVQAVDPEGLVKEWTPRTFYEAAERVFRERQRDI